MPLRVLHLPALFWGSAVVFAAALLLGGGTRPGFVGDVVLQLVAVPLLVFGLAALVRRREVQSQAAAAVRPISASHESSSHVLALLFCAVLALVPLLQLVPLPAGLRGAFAGKTWIDETYALIGEDAPAWPLSLVPHATWLALLSLVPPVAIFVAVLNLSYRERRFLSLLLLAIAIGSAFLGLLQLAQGPQSPLRFYEITNPTEAVGFFANRNHYSALLYTATVFSACWIIGAANKLMSNAPALAVRWYETSGLLQLAAAVLIFMCLVMAQAMARSRAGLLLTALALLAAPVLVMTDRRTFVAHKTLSWAVMAAATVAIAFALQYALYRILERLTFDPLEDTRVQISAKTWQAAKAFLPFGSGVGTFVPVYALFEQPRDTAHFYANHAHNDVFEALLESGVFAFGLMAIFAVWLARRAIAVWTGSAMQGAGDADISLMKAATVALVLLALHSFVDYPLRTSAMMAVAALCAGLLFAPAKWHGHHAGHHLQHEHAHAAGHADVVAREARDARTTVPRGAAMPPSGGTPKAGTSGGSPASTPAPPTGPSAAAKAPAPPSAVKPYERWDGPAEWPAAWQPARADVPPPAPQDLQPKKERKDGSEV